jgi:hypothetical protein
MLRNEFVVAYIYHVSCLGRLEKVAVTRYYSVLARAATKALPNCAGRGYSTRQRPGPSRRSYLHRRELHTYWFGLLSVTDIAPSSARPRAVTV